MNNNLTFTEYFTTYYKSIDFSLFKLTEEQAEYKKFHYSLPVDFFNGLFTELNLKVYNSETEKIFYFSGELPVSEEEIKKAINNIRAFVLLLIRDYMGSKIPGGLSEDGEILLVQFNANKILIEKESAHFKHDDFPDVSVYVEDGTLIMEVCFVKKQNEKNQKIVNEDNLKNNESKKVDVTESNNITKKKSSLIAIVLIVFLVAGFLIFKLTGKKENTETQIVSPEIKPNDITQTPSKEKELSKVNAVLTEELTLISGGCFEEGCTYVFKNKDQKEIISSKVPENVFEYYNPEEGGAVILDKYLNKKYFVTYKMEIVHHEESNSDNEEMIILSIK